MNKKVRIVIIVLSILLILAGGSYLIYHFIEVNNNQDIYDDVQKYKEEPKENEDEEPEEEQEEEPQVEIPIDFASLKAVNSDIYAWIDIEDTNIHYPIAQHSSDNGYYLNHTIEGKQGYPGSIYTENLNAKDFTDFNTLIYGHNMKNGTMFKHLHKFADADFFNSHDTITVYTETEIKTYRIFAAVVYDNRHILYTYANENIEDRKAFIQSLYDSRSFKNMYRDGVEVDENSNLITLSTCISGQPNNRYIVVGIEVK